MKPVIIKSTLLSQFNNLVHGVSTILGGENNFPFKFNLSINVGDDADIVSRNRRLFFNTLNVEEENVVLQEQVHGCNISYASRSELVKENDALYTDKENLFLIVNIADCIPVLLFEPKAQIAAAVHSGWKGTEQEILSHTLDKLEKDFGVKAENLFVYLGPSICKHCYEVDHDVAQKLPPEFVASGNKKYLIDLPGINLKILRDGGIREDRIQISSLCTFEMKNLLHSYRRDKTNSGRMFAIIGVKNLN